ncbi:MAG: class I SAM-dependent methyltransferase [Promethearchaeota archaeon]
MSTDLSQAWNQVADVLNETSIAGECVRYAAAIKPLLALPKTSLIMEAGCGSGRILRTLAALGYHRLVGLEISHERLSEVTRLGSSSAQLICSSAVPFASAAFDAVVSAAVIEHVIDPGSWLKELARVTRSGGLLSIVTDTYMWQWLKRFGVYRSIQPLDEAIWPPTMIRWAQKSGLHLLGCKGFINRPDQRGYFIRQLLKLIPRTGSLQRWFNQTATPDIPSDETEVILDSIRGFNDRTRVDLWSCVWSYECYYWFRKH